MRYEGEFVSFSMARDMYHETVKAALIEDGWEITADPLPLRMPGISYEVDLGAEKIIAASKDNHKIAVEIKSFSAQSDAYEFHRALGQFNVYVLALQKLEPDRELYLAIPSLVHRDFFQLDFIQEVLDHYQIRLIIFDPEPPTSLQWIS